MIEHIPRRGIALFEVLVALALLGIAGVAWIALASQSLRSVESLVGREREVREASMLLARLALEPADALSRRLGVTRAPGFDVRIESGDRRLFSISVHDTLTSARILSTRVYAQPARRHAAP